MTVLFAGVPRAQLRIDSMRMRFETATLLAVIGTTSSATVRSGHRSSALASTGTLGTIQEALLHSIPAAQRHSERLDTLVTVVSEQYNQLAGTEGCEIKHEYLAFALVSCLCSPGSPVQSYDKEVSLLFDHLPLLQGTALLDVAHDGKSAIDLFQTCSAPRVTETIRTVQAKLSTMWSPSRSNHTGYLADRLLKYPDAYMAVVEASSIGSISVFAVFESLRVDSPVSSRLADYILTNASPGKIGMTLKHVDLLPEYWEERLSAEAVERVNRELAECRGANPVLPWPTAATSDCPMADLFDVADELYPDFTINFRIKLSLADIMQDALPADRYAGILIKALTLRGGQQTLSPAQLATIDLATCTKIPLDHMSYAAKASLAESLFEAFVSDSISKVQSSKNSVQFAFGQLLDSAAHFLNAMPQTRLQHPFHREVFKCALTNAMHKPRLYATTIPHVCLPSSLAVEDGQLVALDGIRHAQLASPPALVALFPHFVKAMIDVDLWSIVAADTKAAVVSGHVDELVQCVRDRRTEVVAVRDDPAKAGQMKYFLDNQVKYLIDCYKSASDDDRLIKGLLAGIPPEYRAIAPVPTSTA